MTAINGTYWRYIIYFYNELSGESFEVFKSVSYCCYIWNAIRERDRHREREPERERRQYRLRRVKEKSAMRNGSLAY